MSFRDARSTVGVEVLHREFKGKEGTVLALDGVGLKVREGEVFGVLGDFKYAEGRARRLGVLDREVV